LLWRIYKSKKVDCAWIDISEMDLPSAMRTNVTACGLRKLSAAIEAADGILIAAPVYNYDVAPRPRHDRADGQRLGRQNCRLSLCAAAQQLHAVMATPHLARFSLCHYSAVRLCHQRSFNGENITDKKVTERIEQVAKRLGRFTKALRTLNQFSAGSASGMREKVSFNRNRRDPDDDKPNRLPKDDQAEAMQPSRLRPPLKKHRDDNDRPE